MATKAYLTDSEFQEGQQLFVNGRFASVTERRTQCSKWLGERLEARLNSLQGWQAAQPICLGSWARGELCPKSDVDLLMVGDPSAVADVVGEAQRLGIKIRSRMPEDPGDWTVGVEPFDTLMLFSGRPFSSDAASRLVQQREQLAARKPLRSQILKAIRKERVERQKRHDSISNYLEPQLKLGAGGVRDLEQALAVRSLFGPTFEGERDVFTKINEAKEFLLCLRQLSHWLGGSDILAAGLQPEIARALNFENLSELMRAVQIRLERGSFYADWVVDRSSRATPPQKERRLTPFKALSLFERQPSLANQYLVRKQSKDIWRNLSQLDRGRFLKRLFGRARPDEFWVAMARSLLLEECLPDLKRVKGLTQHDHYHRFTVETHLYQTLRETDRLYFHRKNLLSLKDAAVELKASDWAILRWTALFHDLGKGREKDHSTVGAQLVRQRLGKMGLPKNLIDAVGWLVKNHLILTTAAFRENANQPSTWKRLFDRGVSGIQLNRLSIFSAIDIRATNPESWNNWKAQLLADLFHRLRSPSAVSHEKFFIELASKKTQIPPEILSELDPFLIERLPRQGLIADLKSLARASEDLPVSVRNGGRHQLWVRFHRKQDRPGLFLEFVQKLFWTGARIDAACAMTLQQWGAYDWFLVRTTRRKRELAQRLSQGSENWQPDIPKVRFQSIEVISKDPHRWVISFRGRDQKGLLLGAALALFELGLAIHWARVHTWGNQIDDVFCIEAKGDLQNHLRILISEFVT